MLDGVRGFYDQDVEAKAEWLEESVGDKNRIEDVYERAIANIPPAQEKRYWQRYIYLWINYVLYEELDAQNVDRTINYVLYEELDAQNVDRTINYVLYEELDAQNVDLTREVYK
ncbi:crooked neck-like protein 1 [Dorcoceras hygrometricum]|uniref:Crooked neck-like protein 1 n=1 Tax=Dorcoceras hygrometricum TaxID=472368 RepID=A0A2Z7CVH1_9LAMI|nr:crooked neck-like protein 1 [Dorcoceras hygrometricum]